MWQIKLVTHKMFECIVETLCAVTYHIVTIKADFRAYETIQGTCSYRRTYCGSVRSSYEKRIQLSSDKLVILAPSISRPITNLSLLNSGRMSTFLIVVSYTQGPAKLRDSIRK